MNTWSVGLPGPEKSSVTPRWLAKEVKIVRPQLAALINPDRRRESHFIANPFQNLHDLGANYAAAPARPEKREKISTIVSTRSL